MGAAGRPWFNPRHPSYAHITPVPMAQRQPVRHWPAPASRSRPARPVPLPATCSCPSWPAVSQRRMGWRSPVEAARRHRTVRSQPRDACHRRRVQQPHRPRRATTVMASLGLLRWQTRLVRAGWRTEQTSNAYELVPTGQNPDVSSGGQTGRETKRKIIPTGPSEGSDDWGRWNRDRQLAILRATN